jgi:hypothetical protein
LHSAITPWTPARQQSWVVMAWLAHCQDTATLSEEAHFWEYLRSEQKLTSLLKGWILFQFNVGSNSWRSSSSFSHARRRKTAKLSNRMLHEYLLRRFIDLHISLSDLIRFVILLSSPVSDSDPF